MTDPQTPPAICENCGNEHAAVTLSLCSDCLEGLPDAED